MDRRIALRWNVTGQELELYRTDWPEGVISGGMTAEVHRGLDTNDQASLWTPSVALDSTAIAVNAASGYSRPNRKRLMLASTAGLVVGRIYYAENELGQREQVRPKGIGSNYADMAYDLAYDYNADGISTATLRGLRASFVVDASFIAVPGNINLPSAIARYGDYSSVDRNILELVDSTAPYKILWLWTLGGTPRRHWTYFDVVRNPQQHGVLPQDLYDRYPDLRFNEPPAQRGVMAVRFIELAWEVLQRDLRQHRVEPASLADGHALDMLLIDCTMMMIADASVWTPRGVDAPQFRRERTGAYLRNLEASIRTMRQSQNQDGSITPNPTPPVTFRS